MSERVWCDVAFSHVEVPIRVVDAGRARGAKPGGVVCAVIDVLRATSTIVTALGNGCRAIYPCPSPDAARAKALELRDRHGREQILLGGEQDGAPIEGFDAGNSPREYTSGYVGGRALVLSTSNGTKTLAASADCGWTYIVALANLSASARRLSATLREDGARTLLIACSGRERGYCEDDAIVAGLLIDAIKELMGEGRIELSDSARAAVRVARGAGEDLPREMLDCFWGRHLTKLGMEEDVRFCVRRDWTEVVPILQDGVIEAG